MNNEPVAWMSKEDFEDYLSEDKRVTSATVFNFKLDIPLYTQDQLEKARKLGMQQERALWNLTESTQEIVDTHPVKELTDEEILSVLGDQKECNFLDVDGWEIHNVDWVGFARAILRRAQEK